MEDKPLIIPIDQIKADFDKFLTPEHNRRIIFSGPFGIGKTYFLHKFFDDKEEYFPVFLRPINYSLLSNEDVFRFIKYDILCQLVENEKFDIEDSFDFTEWDYTKLFLGQNGFAILFNLLKYMPKIGTYVKASQKLGVLVEKFQEGMKSFNENKELKSLKEFGEQTENHFLFENDGVTEFISQQMEKIVSQQSEGEQKKKKVLIIDDLDRLDPEHIFRLFNVFSAHFDQVHYYENANGNDNKFGFDKIIFVCDNENIRKIFAHKYGAEVDFAGYIDKFYSSKIFIFNNNQQLIDYVDDIFRNYEGNVTQRGGTKSSILSIVKPIICDFISATSLNMRIIENIMFKKISFRDPYTLNYFKPEIARNYNFTIVQAVDLLYDIYGANFENLLEAIRKAKSLKRNNASLHKEKHLSYFLPILNPVIKANKENCTWDSPWAKALNYKLLTPIEIESEIYYAEIEQLNKAWILSKNYYELLELVVLNLKNMGVFEKNME